MPSLFLVFLFFTSVLSKPYVKEQTPSSTQGLEMNFQDADGVKQSLSKFWHNSSSPVQLIQFIYFNCPSICSPFLNETMHSMRVLDSDLKLGVDYDLWSVSISPKENFQLANQKKRNYIDELSKLITVPHPDSWHFLSSDSQSIANFTEKVGFYFDPLDSIDFNHRAIILVLDGEQRLTRYIHGPMLYPMELKTSILYAQGGILNHIQAFYLEFIYDKNEQNGHYVLSLSGLALFWGVISVLLLGQIWLVWRTVKKVKCNKKTSA